MANILTRARFGLDFTYSTTSAMRQTTTPVGVDFVTEAKKRTEKEVMTLQAGGSVTISLADKGYSRTALFCIVCQTPGAEFTLSLNGSLTAINYTAPQGQRAFHLGTGNVESYTIGNPHTLASIDVEITYVEPVSLV